MKLRILDFFKNLRIVQEYKKINSNLFSTNKKTRNIILVEFNAFHSDHIFFSYFSNVLSNKLLIKVSKSLTQSIFKVKYIIVPFL